VQFCKQLRLFIGYGQVSKKRRPVKRSEPSSTIDNHVRSDEVEKECPAELKAGDPGPVQPKRKSKNRTDGDENVPLGKKPRKSKSMNKKDRDRLNASIMALESSIFHGIITDKLKEEQTLSEKLKYFATSFLENVELLDEIIAFHCYYFATLYTGCKKGPDPFMRLQFQWHDHCSSLLSSEQYSYQRLAWRSCLVLQYKLQGANG